MTMYTVIGIYDDGLTFADDVEASDAYDAMHAIAGQRRCGDLQIIGAIEGSHNLIAAYDESGKAAYACDLVEDEEQS